MIIPIRGATVPETAALLTERIEAGLAALGMKARAVKIEAPAWPAVAELALDLTGTSVEKPDEFPRLAGAGEGALEVGHLLLEGRPLLVQGLPLHIELQARAAVLQVIPLSGGHHALVLQKAAEGSLDLSSQASELERFAHTLLAGLARKNGAELVQTRLQFTSRGPRALSFQAEITAKMMMMKVPIVVAGDLDLGDDLQLRISNLRLTGSGMAAGLARGFLQPHFDKLQERPIDLGTLALGALRLRDVGLTIESDTLRLHAQFGS